MSPLMPATLHLHRQKLLLIFSIAFGSLAACLWVGTVKHWSEIDWLDVVGEGGSAIAVGVWIFLILGSRPAGRVTDLLSLGLGFMFIAMWQDSLDEFIRVPAGQLWDQWLESGAMPVGIAILTYGLYHWHQEQLSVNSQLRRREQLFRDHRYIDGLTQLGRAAYLKQHIQRRQLEFPGASLALVMAEIQDYPQLARRLGHREADRLLREVAEILLLNIRQQDVICRFAGDRFAVVLGSCTPEQAMAITGELQQAIAHFAFKNADGDTLYQRICAGVVMAPDETDADALIEQGNAALLQARQQQGTYLAA
ncbi:GGDEF domain-containing protein [Thalassolituus sp. LLYu03]|uniref:GGDEF domain-containing protein n=1 Tax=Thalassolituus sp. LLYu03 TaxID=3421656 RepID=UPI003D2C5539